MWGKLVKLGLLGLGIFFGLYATDDDIRRNVNQTLKNGWNTVKKYAEKADKGIDWIYTKNNEFEKKISYIKDGKDNLKKVWGDYASRC